MVEHNTIGLNFATKLMRSSSNGVYFKSLATLLSRSKLYILAVGDKVGDEPFWIIGKELFTFYSWSKGFSILKNSVLENILSHSITKFESPVLENFSVLKVDPVASVIQDYLSKRVFPTIQSLLNSITIDKPISVYRIITSSRPYYLECIAYKSASVTPLLNFTKS